MNIIIKGISITPMRYVIDDTQFSIQKRHNKYTRNFAWMVRDHYEECIDKYGLIGYVPRYDDKSPLTYLSFYHKSIEEAIDAFNLANKKHYLKTGKTLFKDGN